MSETDYIHRFVPAPDAGAAPTLVLLHGTGGSENDLIQLGAFLQPGANLLGVRGNVLENGLARFFRRVAEGVFDPEDLRLRTNQLARWVAEAANEYNLRTDAISVVGYSNGANIAASILLTRAGLFSSAMLLHAMAPFTPERFPDLCVLPVFMAAGRNDPVCTPAQTESLAALLRAANAHVHLYWHEGGHHITEDEANVARDWVQANERRLNGQEAVAAG